MVYFRGPVVKLNKKTLRKSSERRRLRMKDPCTTNSLQNVPNTSLLLFIASIFCTPKLRICSIAKRGRRGRYTKRDIKINLQINDSIISDMDNFGRYME